jgi:hypothetical protein
MRCGDIAVVPQQSTVASIIEIALFDAFLPEVGKFVDFEHLSFIDKELVTLDGKKRTGDLLVKTSFRHQPVGLAGI